MISGDSFEAISDVQAGRSMEGHFAGAASCSAQSCRTASYSLVPEPDIQAARSINSFNNSNLIVLARLSVDLAWADERGSNGCDLTPFCAPFRQPAFKPPCIETALAQGDDSPMGVYAIGPAAIGNDVSIGVEVCHAAFQAGRQSADQAKFSVYRAWY